MNTTITPLDPATLTGKAKELTDKVQAKMGSVPNIFKVMANAPATLQTYLSVSEALGQAKLSVAVREQVAIALANTNNCGYCLSAHTAIGQKAGVDAANLKSAQSGKSSDAKAQAAIDLALTINKHHGGPELAKATQTARAAGLSDEEILETAAVVVINILTNAVNGLAQTPIDFPKVDLSKAA